MSHLNKTLLKKKKKKKDIAVGRASFFTREVHTFSVSSADEGKIIETNRHNDNDDDDVS